MSNREELVEKIADEILKATNKMVPLLRYDTRILANDFIDLIEQSRWISVEDELPEHKGQKDVLTKNGIRINDHWFNGKYFINPNVTHWMNRPKPPTEDR